MLVGEEQGTTGGDLGLVVRSKQINARNGSVNFVTRDHELRAKRSARLGLA